MTYAELRKQAIRARNNQNRSRSKAMERDVAKALNGKRVPMSGAGYLKGDCEVDTDKCGRIYIECKHSSLVHKRLGSYIGVDHKWLVKMCAEAQTMRASFAVLIVQYHGTRLTRYVIMPTTAFAKHGNMEQLSTIFSFGTEKLSAFRLVKSVVDEALAIDPYIPFYSRAGSFVIMTLDSFKELINDPTE